MNLRKFAQVSLSCLGLAEIGDCYSAKSKKEFIAKNEAFGFPLPFQAGEKARDFFSFAPEEGKEHRQPQMVSLGCLAVGGGFTASRRAGGGSCREGDCARGSFVRDEWSGATLTRDAQRCDGLFP